MISSLDHVAVPIADVSGMLSFYRSLGFTVVDDHAPFYSVHFGDNRINFHGPEAWQSERFTLRGPKAVPGCGDFCFVWQGAQAALDEMLSRAGISVIEGPVQRRGGKAESLGMSTYIRDPDHNLLEFIIY